MSCSNCRLSFDLRSLLHLLPAGVLECGMRKILFTGLWALALLLTACQAGNTNSTAGEFLEPTAPGSLLGDKAGLSAAVSVLDSSEYEIAEHFLITNHGPGSPSKHNLWAALIQDLPPYQDVLEMSISAQDFRTFEDENGNLIAEFDLSGLPPGESVEVEIRYKVKVNQLAYDLSQCVGDLPTAFTSAELYIESNNPQIRSLAAELASGKSNPCEQVRAFYDYVGDNLVYTYNGRDWGAQAALGEMGADCSEYASLVAALARAAGIPARYLEGVLHLEPETQALARSEHAWLEVYLPNIGWTPMDPTLGRPLGLRDEYFAANSPDHIVVTRGRNPSALRGGSYYTHIYWPGPSAVIKIEEFGWEITPIQDAVSSP
jgi:transglutaminase-like putative cysteine protease